MNAANPSRRRFIKHTSLVASAGALAPSLLLNSHADAQNRKVGYALVGLGNYSTSQLGPALKGAKNCYLAGVVTGTPTKAREWAKEYELADADIYNYDNFDQIADNNEIDVVYVVLPNSMHAEYTIRALNAGKHVICEKPMAVTAAEAKRMMDAAKRNKRKLAIGYRMHYDPYFIEVKRLGQNKALGEINFMECTLSYRYAPSAGSWKLKRSMGGGPFLNLGVYPIQSARHTKGAEPVALTAVANTQRSDIFSEVHEHISWTMEFADGCLANCFSGASSHSNRLWAGCEDGFIELNTATAYRGQSGSSSLGAFDYPQVFQQRLQVEDFARCILEDDESIVSGNDGYRDMLVIDAVYASIAAGGARVQIG